MASACDDPAALDHDDYDVSRYISIVDSEANRCGMLIFVKDLNAKICVFIDGQSARRQPFVWNKPAEQIFTKCQLQTS